MRIIAIFFIVAFLVSCGGRQWVRVSNFNRSLQVDRVDCDVLAKQLVKEMGDFSYKTIGGGYLGSSGFYVGSSKTVKKADKYAIGKYFRECMYGNGWTIVKRGHSLTPLPQNTKVKKGYYVLLNLKQIRQDEVVSELIGGLYHIGARQLSPDVEVRLSGRMVGDSIEFKKRLPNYLPDKQLAGQDVTLHVEIIGLYSDTD